MNKIPTFEECLEITQASECFTHRYREVNGVKVSIFDYLLASYPDFDKPIKDSELKAFELRGLCFTHNEDGSVNRRFLMLNKFFNLNQCQTYQYEDVKHKKIRKIMDKMDGSVMRFIRLPNGQDVVKSKTFFDNDQTTMAKMVYDQNKNLQEFVRETLDQELAAIWELVSPNNKIVIDYQKTELVLLQIRDEKTGEYLDIYSHPLVLKHKVKTVQAEPIMALEEIMELAQTVQNKEGWILEFEDGQLMKIKTQWYIELHGLMEQLSCEDRIMTFIINNTIDDAIAELKINDPRRQTIENLIHGYNHYLVQKTKDVLEFATTYKGDRKEWAIAYRKHPLFHYAARIVDLPEDQKEDRVIFNINQEVLAEVYYLSKARKFITEELKLPLLFQSGFSFASDEN